MLNKSSHNPDVLTCLANLSNDEVFTLPKMVNEILDLLPQEIWSDKNVKFLDPVCKSGVFLREIAARLKVGLEATIPDNQERINHIFENQLFGIAITELTSLLSRRSVYCSKTANGKYSVCEVFDNQQGNILFDHTKHTWLNGKCQFCGASQVIYDRSIELESHAYQFIHTNKPQEIYKMKFDVIVGNPPYQLSDAGYGTSASPIYNVFVQQAKKLNPRFLTMIIPARWFSGGKSLDEFRDEMLGDNRIREIHDFPEAADCFPGVQIKGGVCYFLWDRDNPGLCRIVTHRNGEVVSTSKRPLLESGCDTFIRYNEAIPIVKKVRSFGEPSIKSQVSPSKPFGLRTFVIGEKNPFKDCVKLYQNGGIGYVPRTDLTANSELVNKFKVFVPALGSGSDSFPHPILGKPIIGEPDSACTETYLVVGVFDDRTRAHNTASYIATRFFRFLVLLNKPAQHATSKVYSFVPIQDFDEPWTDEKLYKKYDLTEKEIAFIESMVRPMELDNE
jgi:site-specific DNA-methyltransferase (adenine-specific)